MLVLTRRLNQSIVISDPKIGDEIEITVVEIRGDQVRLGIKAPPAVTVDRKEIAVQKAAGAAFNRTRAVLKQMDDSDARS